MILIAAILLAGCGDSSTDSTATTGGKVEYEAEPAPGGGAPAGASAASCETQAVDAEALRATGLPCAQARRVMFAWQRASACELGDAGRGGCTVGAYRCVATRSERGAAVSLLAAGGLGRLPRYAPLARRPRRCRAGSKKRAIHISEAIPVEKRATGIEARKTAPV